MESCTCTAPVNIAVVKYWGKRDEQLILPVNSSVSVTLHQDQLKAKTTITAGKDFSCDRMWLNSREESIDTPRIQNLLKEIRHRARSQGKNNNIELLDWKIHICSENNFPTAAGLASSAAGFACLAFTLAQLYKVEGDISDIARRGSGSACRSTMGGFVVWETGEREDGTDSVVRQIAPEHHWPELRALILVNLYAPDLMKAEGLKVVSDQKKHIGSSEGMQTTLRTSELMSERVRCVPERVQKISEAIENEDFHTFAELTMKDSNQLHAVCLDTYPPISYMTDVSRQIVTLVHAYNRYHGQNKVAYTFDAGPNPCLYLLKEDVARVSSLIAHFFPPMDVEEEFTTGLPLDIGEVEKECLSTISLPIQGGAIKYMIHTRPGPGPLICTNPKDSLLDQYGLPKQLKGDKRKLDCVS